MPSSLLTRYFPALALTAALSACGGDETSPEEGHTPVSAAVFVDGTDVTSGLAIEAGQTVRVEVRFYDEHGEEITGIDATHFASLTFTPVTLATAADVAGEHFQKDVIAGTEAGAGTYAVGYGHDEAADELTFGGFPVSVVLTGGAAR